MSMSQRPAATREPLDGLQRSRYRKIKDINSGSYGFVQLCQDNRTNEQVAVKFIERGEKVSHRRFAADFPDIPAGAVNNRMAVRLSLPAAQGF